jgi:general L-amino acid transport system substrate-binding protein
MLRNGLIPGLSAGLVAAMVCAVSGPSHAASRLCALRDGPRGPCTCKSDADGPGQFTVVPKSRCRAAASGSAKKDAAPASEAAAETSAGSAAPAASGAEAANASSEPAPVATLDAVRQRGKVLCGVNTGLLGFSARTDSGAWAGLDVDFCRAVAAAVLGDGSKVEFVPLETNERFEALTDGKVDILSRNTTWTMSREVELGLRFAGVLYFDGQGFMTGDDRGFVSAQQLAGSKVCVEGGTTTEKNMAYFFKVHQIEVETVVRPTREEMLKAYADGTCDTYSGDRSALYADRASFAEPAKHAILPEVISKEPLGPVVLKGDEAWAEIVRWTLAGLINAEEVGLDKAAAASTGALSDDAQRLVDGAGVSGERMGLGKSWLRDVVAAVGNYGEMFEANVGRGSPLGMERGLNALWKRGGILTAPPMW